MPKPAVHLLYRLRHTLQAAAGAVPDAELLARYAHGGDQAAFELILWRHGPMVWGVCRRVLGHTQDAEDAFQAAFLALARQAASLRDGAALAGFLYRVAHRAALAARTARRRTRPGEITADLPTHAPADDPARSAAGREMAAFLDEEVARLPQRLRLPFILCHLEGRSRAETAADLQCSAGAVESRLHRARALLRSRLARRGVALPGALLAPAVPATLRAAALQHAAAPAAAAGLPAALLAERALRSLAPGALKKCLAGVLAACLLVTGISLAALRPDAPPPVTPPPPARAATDAVPLPPEAAARVGSTRLRHGDGVVSLAFSPDGRWIASAANDNTARVWEAATGRMRLRVPLKGPWRVYRVAFTPDGKSLVILDDGSCRIVDLLTGKERAAHPHPPEHAVSAAAVAPGGSLFATAESGKDLSVCDARTGNVKYSLPLKGTSHPEVAFSADARSFVVQCSREIKGLAGELRVFDAATGKHRVSVHDGKRGLGAPALAPDGKSVAALSSGDSGGDAVVLWDVGSGKVLRRITGLEATPYCIAFSPDGKLLAVGNLQRLWLQLFDVATGKEVRRLRCWPSVYTVAFSPDGKTLAAGKSEGTISLWDVATGKPRPASPDPDGSVFHLRFTDGGRSLLAVAGDITLRDWRTGRLVRRYPDPRKDNFMGLSVSPDLETLAVCDFDGAVRLVEARTGKELHVLKGHRAAADRTLFAPDGRRLFTLGYDNTVRVWDVAKGEQLHRLAVARVNSAAGLAVSPDGKVLAAVCPTTPGGPYEVRLWDTAGGRELRRLTVPAIAWALAFSPDGTRIACVGQDLENGRLGVIRGVVLLWDVASGRQLRSFAGHRGSVYGLAFSPDGRTLATGGHDHTVRLWEVATGKERHRFTGHDSPVGMAIAFSPDGRFLAAASADAPVFVWDVTGTGRRPAPAAWGAAQRDRLWQELASADAVAGFKAVRWLVASPEAAVGLLRDRLKPAPARDEGRLRQLVRDLDSDDFQTRQRAQAALKKVAGDIDGMLRREREKPRSLEVRRRLDEILRGAEGPSPAGLRQSRAVEVLELLATPEAAGLLDRLAAGASGSRLTDEASAARLRLRRRAGQ